MRGKDQELQLLLKLALDKSLQGRKRLALAISALTTDPRARISEQERDLITEILKKLLSELEAPVRRDLGERLANSPNAPHDLVLMLANDRIEVALPVLVTSDILRDAELIEIIRQRGVEHQLAIARRKQLSEMVSRALVETDDSDVIKTLLENDNARISQATMAYLVEESRRVDSFHEPLIKRKELDPTLAKRLYWWVVAALRRHILEHFDLHPSELDPALEEAVRANIASQAAEHDSDRPGAAARLAQRLAEADAITPELLVKVLRQGEVPLFEALFGELSGISPPRLQRILFEPDGESLAIVCRALNFPKQSFATLFMLSRAKGSATDPRELMHVGALFDRVSPENAHHIVEVWRRDTGFLDAIEQLEESMTRQKRN